MDGKLNILQGDVRVSMISANHSKVLGKVSVGCSVVLNRWTYIKNKNEVWILVNED